MTDYKIIITREAKQPGYCVALATLTDNGLFTITKEKTFCKTYKEAKAKQKEITQDLQDMGNYFDYLQPILKNQ